MGDEVGKGVWDQQVSDKGMSEQEQLGSSASLCWLFPALHADSLPFELQGSPLIYYISLLSLLIFA